MSRFKRSAVFTLAVMPIAIIATVLVTLYQFELYPPEIMEEAVAQIGSKWLLILISLVQSIGMIVFCSFVGFFLAEGMGLIRPWRIEKHPLLISLGLSALTGVLFSFDYWTFGAWEPLVRDTVPAAMTPQGIFAAVFYGGIVEEILLRLFFLTLIAWGLKKTVFKKREGMDSSIFLMANLIAALVFAAGHLPSTIVTFGAITPLLLFRCFLFNGGIGFVFGHLYCKHGLQYAMMGHALTHLVARLIWWVFI